MISSADGEWHGGGTPEQIIDGNSVTWEIQKADIVEVLQNCDEYRVLYQDYLKGDAATMLCEWTLNALFYGEECKLYGPIMMSSYYYVK